MTRLNFDKNFNIFISYQSQFLFMGFFYCIFLPTYKFDLNTLSLFSIFNLIILLIISYPLFFGFEFLILTHLDFIYFSEFIALFDYLSFSLIFIFEFNFQQDFYCQNIWTFDYRFANISWKVYFWWGRAHQSVLITLRIV